MMKLSLPARRPGAVLFALGIAATAAACNRAPEQTAEQTAALTPDASGAGRATYIVHDTVVAAVFDAAGTAGPLQQATLSTKLMGTVTDVLVKEGDVVAAGQTLVRIDARDLAAKSAQVAASVAEAEAVERDATTQANRIRALYADSAATRAQLDAAETGLARAEAGLAAARAAAAELGAVSSYAVVRAPFRGIVTKRFVDPGAFAAPGAPLVAIEDASTLRISASATPELAQRLRRGQSIAATVEGRTVRATIEGVVPAMAGNLYTINALVSNGERTLLAGSTATLSLSTGDRHVLLVPVSAVVHEGDLAGVTLRGAHGDERRWVRLGRVSGDMIEVLSGLAAGDAVVMPGAHAAPAAVGS